jgi:hypothetical protein
VRVSATTSNCRQPLCLWSAPHGNRYAGLDVGEHRLFAAVIDTDMEPASISFSPDTEPTLVLDWCIRKSPQNVAIDSPPAHSKGLAEIGNRRVAGGATRNRRLLRHSPIGVAVAALDWRWVCVAIPKFGGCDERDGLGSRRHGQGIRSAPHIRVSPHCLVSLTMANGSVAILRSCLRPKAPRGSIGHIQRVGILRVLLEDLGVVWTPTLSEKLRSSLDWTMRP